MVALHYFPGIGINLATAALVGMAAMFAGASRALLTSIVFALETTGQVNGLLPLLGGCVAAYFVSFFFMEGSIMTEKIKRRGVSAPDSFEPDTLRGIRVQELFTKVALEKTDLPTVYSTDDAGLAAEMMGKYNVDTLLVVDPTDEARRVKGIITSAVILEYYSRQKQKEHVYHSPGRTRRILVQGRKLLLRGRE